MSQISRLKSAQIQNGNLINADDINAELNQQVNESNNQDTRLSGIESGTFVQTGTLSTSNPILADAVNERSNGSGVVIDNVRHQDGYVNLQSVLATAASVDTVNDALLFSGNHGIATSTPVRLRILGTGSLPSGISAGITYYAYATSSTTLKLYSSSANALAGGSTGLIDISTAGSGKLQVIGTPSLVKEGDLFVNATGLAVCLNGSVKALMENEGLPFPRHYSKSAAPRYASPTSMSLASIQERAGDDSSNIVKNTSTTVDITTTGLNGIAQSANLSGTVSVTAGSAALTFSTSQTGILQAGDIVTTAGGQARKLVSVSGSAAMADSQFTVTESSVSFKRGGRASFYASASGTVGSSFLYLYAISDGAIPGLILSTRNLAGGDSLVDLPTGYNAVRQLPFALTLYNIASGVGVYAGNMVPFKIGSGWPSRTEVLYDINVSSAAGGFVPGDSIVLNAGTSTTVSSVDASAWVPKISRLFIPNLLCYGRPSSYVLRETGTSVFPLTCGDFNGGNAYQGRPLGLNAAGQFDYKGLLTTGPLYVDVMGYIVTEL